MIACKRQSTCGLCRATGRLCERYAPARVFKPFGWIVTVRHHGLRPDSEHHYCNCRETDARRKAMLTRCAAAILSIEPVETREQWVRCFGNPDERGL
jgi:hypothetical protein